MQKIIHTSSYLLPALVAFLWVLPFDPTMPRDRLDPSWNLVLHHALVQGWVFGRDLIWPLGPLGFLYRTTFMPETYWLLFFGRLAYLVVVLTALIHFDQKFERPGWHRAIWLFFTLFWMFLWPEVWYSSVSILLLFGYFSPQRAHRKILYLLTVFAAFASLIKFSLLVPALMIVALIAVHQIFVERKAPTYLLAYTAAFLLFRAATGQPLEALPEFIRGSLALANGYGAMSLPGPSSQVFLAILSVLLIVLIVAEHVRSEGSAASLLLLMGILFLLAINLKGGFVRHDSGHVYRPFVVCFIFALLLWLPLRTRGNHRLRLLLPVSLATTSFCFAIVIVDNQGSLVRFFEKKAHLVVRSAAGLQRLVVNGFGIEHLETRYRRRLDQIAQQNPVMPLRGSVDVYSFGQTALLSHGFEYRPRPIFQSIMGYSPWLNRINARHLESSQAADNILFAVEPIDGRFPTLEENLSWLLLVSLYELHDEQPVNGSERFIPLRRAPRPKPYRMIQGVTATAEFGESVALPEGDGAIWSQIDIETTALGRLLAALYKAPLLHLIIETDDGASKRFRLLPATARSGFLLSPLIDSNQRFLRFMKGTAATTTRSIKVVSEGIGAGWFYRSEFAYQFNRIEFDRRNAKRSMRDDH